MSFEIIHGNKMAAIGDIHKFKKSSLECLALFISRCHLRIFTIDRHDGSNDRQIFCVDTMITKYDNDDDDDDVDVKF